MSDPCRHCGRQHPYTDGCYGSAPARRGPAPACTRCDMLRAENEQLRALLRDRLDATAGEVLVIEGMRAARRLARAVRMKMSRDDGR